MRINVPEPVMADKGERLNMSVPQPNGGTRFTAIHPNSGRAGAILSFDAEAGGGFMITLSPMELRLLGAHFLHLADVLWPKEKADA